MSSELTKMILCGVILAVAALGLPLSAAPGDILWSEDFESYTVGNFIGQDPCWAFVNEEPDCNDIASIMDYETTGSKVLHMATQNKLQTGGQTWFRGTRDLVGEIVTESDAIAVEFYLGPSSCDPYWPSNRQVAFYLMDVSENVIASLYLRDPGGTPPGIYLFNGVDLGEPYWNPNTMNHFRITLDFAGDTAAIYPSYAIEPRATVDLSADFSALDIAKIRFGAGWYYSSWGNVYWAVAAIDNIKITDNTRPDCPQGDASGDCVVDLKDFALVSNYWQVVGELDPNDPNLLK